MRFKFTVVEMFFSFLGGVILTSLALLLLLLHRNCSCSLKRSPSADEITSFLYILSAIMVAWIVGVVVTAIKDRV